MRVLFIERTPDGLLDLAVRARALGHQALYHLATYDQYKNPVGRGLVERVADWRTEIRRVDLVICGGNDHCQREFDAWRQRGIPIVGSSVEAESWETDRAKGMAVFRQCGIPVPPYREFDNYDSAIQYVKKHDQPFVSKPSGRCDDKAMSYVSKSPEDLVYMLERWKRAGKRTGEPFILQEKVEGVEFAVGAWFGPSGFVPEWEENAEFKKLFAGNLGPATGEMGCYSSDTEVLTKTGWKYWSEVTTEDELATRLPSGLLTYETPSQVVVYDVDCAMVGWKNQSIDVLVTPNHNMFVATQSSARSEEVDEYQFIQADQCLHSQYAVPRTARWEGEPFSVPEFCGNEQCTPEAWAKFIGLYIAEGCASGKTVYIAASHPEKSQEVGKIIDATGLSFSSRNCGFNIYNAKLARDLRPFGRSWEKFVPPEIKDASPGVISAFLEGYALGDGNMQPNGFRVFYTSSKRLADDVQELLLKIGRLGLIKRRDREGIRSYIDGRPIWTRRPAYEVIERPRKLRSWLDKRDRYEVRYSGKVYCAEVTHHTLFVRRDGKPMWCGNTVSRWSTKSKLADAVLKPLETFLHRAGFIGCVDVNCIIDSEDGTVFPLEFTTRGGWPALNLECSAFDCDFVHFFYDLAHGNPPKQVHKLEEVVCGVVLALPDFPYSHATRKEVVGVPIYGITPRLMPHLHFAQVMVGEAPVSDGGIIRTGSIPVSAGDYVAIVTGNGATVTAARRQAYSHIKSLSMPSGSFYRNDIGARLAKDIPALQAHGFAAGWTY